MKQSSFLDQTLQLATSGRNQDIATLFISASFGDIAILAASLLTLYANRNWSAAFQGWTGALF